ncbi:MAG TPA: hypothetical protein VN903_02060 [Polyangia bacterium]|nr:hypothetical protein [Polyangia bacterium]
MVTKEEIKRRLLVAKYPRRADADPRTAPDHNPLVLEDCPLCHGSGTRCEGGPGYAALLQCPECKGEGTTYALVPRFANANPPLAVRAGDDGWLTCPNCGLRFAPTDRDRWTGLRHVTCGQRLLLEPLPPAL